MGLQLVGLIAAVVAAISITRAINLPGVPTDFSDDNNVMSAIVDDVATKLEQEYMIYWKTGIESTLLKQITVHLANSHSKKDMFTKELTELETRDHFAICTLCRATTKVIVNMVREEDGELNGPNSEELMKKIALDTCLRFKLATEEVCKGLIEFNYPTIDYIIRNSEADSRSFCSLFMEFNFCNVIGHPEYDWTLSIDNSAPAITGPKSDIPKRSESDLKICHITDIHLDPLYEAGSLAECDEPLCCQRDKSEHEGTNKAAGYWGDYRDCDSPWHMFDMAVEHIANNHKCDLVIQTGDIIDHMVWATSVEKNSEVLTRVSKRLAEAFGDIPVYHCIGNHEPHPLNLFSPSYAPSDINTKWLYEHLYTDWAKWLPESAKATMLEGGYYTVSPKPGYRIIALNSNDCYSENYWLFYNGTNKQPQLQWLHDVCLGAEKAGEFVHILTHIPSGDGTCWSTWAREYNRIIERFHKTISAIFNGHSHKDELNVHYSSQGLAMAVSWNGGALTTFSYKNPNYRVYDVDPISFQVLNHHTYIFNLTEANLKPNEKPIWFEEYEFAKEFTADTSPNGIDKLLIEFADNPDLLRKFWRYKMTSASPRLEEGCDRRCLQRTLCRAATTVNTDTARCELLKARLNAALDGETILPTEEPLPTDKPTEKPTEKPTDKPQAGGAAFRTALSLSTFVCLYLALKQIF